MLHVDRNSIIVQLSPCAFGIMILTPVFDYLCLCHKYPHQVTLCCKEGAWGPKPPSILL